MKIFYFLAKTILIFLIMCSTFRSIAQVPVNFTVTVPAALVVNAGPDSATYMGSRILIGGSPAITGGSAPYDIVWVPSVGLSSAYLANPWAYPTKNTNYVLTVMDKNGCSATDQIYVKYINTGISDNTADMQVNVFPNPAKGTFNLSLEGNYQDFALNISVINSVGKVIYSDMVFKVYGKIDKPIDLTGYSRGVYVIRITGDNTNIVKKLFLE